MSHSSIDAIWLALKDKSSCQSMRQGKDSYDKGKSIAHLWETRKSSTTTATANRKCTQPNSLRKLSCNQNSEYIDNMISKLSEERCTKEGDETKMSSLKIASSLFDDEYEDEAETKLQNIPSNRIVYDSDDDSDLSDFDLDLDTINRTDNSSNTRSCPNVPDTILYARMKIERLANVLQSEERKYRLDALVYLEQEIRSLAECVDAVPELHTESPYSFENIALTHKRYDATISDLAKGDHVSNWQLWQRTKVPITEQFRNNDSSERNREAHAETMQKDSNLRMSDSSDAKQKLQIILNACGQALFQRFSDPSEKCRILAINGIRLLCISGLDIGKHIAYLMPAIFSRFPQTKYDPVMHMFITDTESHEFYKRGGATQRQDRMQIAAKGGCSYHSSTGILEPSEEVRLQLCELISCVIRVGCHLNALSLLDAYFSDIIVAIYSGLNDSFTKLKTAAADLLVHILRLPSWEEGAKHYATAIARAALPQLRHRSARVRISFIALFEASISVPDREKIKGAGTEAIKDLVGFREENVLPIAAFYRRECGLTVNSLAELMGDTNANVRFRCCQMLSFLICCLPDRYDYQQRLLPYLLSFYNDDHPKTREVAIMAIEQCGHQYEVENPNDIIEKRQLGVDGDRRCNHTDKLPPPFKQRPRLGARLFVRGNTKRFFSALLSELKSWIPKTRHQSANLLHILVVYCEEHLTMDFNITLVAVVRALHACISESDKDSKDLQDTLESLLTTMGRYVDPDTYVKLLIPRITGDVQSGTSFSEGGCHSELSCVANAIALRCMISGSMPNRVLPFVFTMLTTLASQNTLGNAVGNKIKTECLTTLSVLFNRIEGHSIIGAQTACFQESGRLCSGDKIMKQFKSTLNELQISSSGSRLRELATNVKNSIPKEFDDIEHDIAQID